MNNTRTDTDSRPFQTGNVLLISFSHLLNDTYAAFVAPVLPLLISKFGLSYFLAGILTAGIRLPALLNPLIGILADRTRLRYFIILAPALTGVTLSLLGAAPSYAVLVGLTFTAGLTSTAYHVTGPVLMKHFAGARVGRGMSFFMLGGDLAATIGPLVILGAVSLWGLAGTYRLMFVGFAAAALMYLRFRRIRVHHRAGPRPEPGSLWQTSKTLLPFFLCMTGMYLAITAVEAALTSFLPTYLTTVKGTSLWAAGASLSLLQLGGLAGNLTAGPLSDYFGRQRVLLIILAGLPLMMGLFVLSPGILMLPLLVVLGMFLFGLRPVVLALVHDLESAHPSYVNGIYYMITFVATSTMILLVGVVSDQIGLEQTFRLAALLSAGALVFAAWLPKTLK
jgi:MFS transporter, FSR family, fosmidomycin resistance protein